MLDCKIFGFITVVMVASSMNVVHTHSINCAAIQCASGMEFLSS